MLMFVIFPASIKNESHLISPILHVSRINKENCNEIYNFQPKLKLILKSCNFSAEALSSFDSFLISYLFHVLSKGIY